MLRGIYGDPERYRDTYWSRFPGRYFAGDGAKLDEDGYLWLLGRVDDVMNVSGHRISTTEVESALVDHPAVAESAVVGADRSHDRAGHRGLRHPPGRRRRGRRRHGPGAARRTWPTRSGPSPGPSTVVFTDDLPEDPERQDHAPPPARRGRGPGARGHHHPGRPAVVDEIRRLAAASPTDE